MKKRILFLAVGFGVLALGSGLSVTAQNSGTTSTQLSADREARVAERKERLQATTDLSQARLERISSRCENAQSTLVLASEAAQQAVRSRTAVYDQIAAQLDSVIERVGSNADTLELQTQTSELRELVSLFVATTVTYPVVFDDVTSVDCVNEAESFILALQDLRDVRSQAKTQTEDIQSLLSGEITDALTTIKEALSSAQSADEATDS